MVTTAEKWRFIRKTSLDTQWLSKALVGIVIAFCVCWIGTVTAIVIVDPSKFKWLIALLIIIAVLMSLSLLIFRHPIAICSRRQRLCRRGLPATARCLAKDADTWRPDYAVMEKFVVVLDVVCVKDHFQIESRVDPDTYARAQIGAPISIVIDYDHRCWAWGNSEKSE